MAEVSAAQQLEACVSEPPAQTRAWNLCCPLRGHRWLKLHSHWPVAVVVNMLSNFIYYCLLHTQCYTVSPVQSSASLAGRSEAGALCCTMRIPPAFTVKEIRWRQQKSKIFCWLKFSGNAIQSVRECVCFSREGLYQQSPLQEVKTLISSSILWFYWYELPN